MKQVISISPDGVVTGLQRKSGQGLDLRQFGEARIKRISEIVWCENEQLWVAVGHLGWLEGHALNAMLANEAGIPVTHPALANATVLNTLLVNGRPFVMVPAFRDYDDAVAWEIAVLDGLRSKGIPMPE